MGLCRTLGCTLVAGLAVIGCTLNPVPEPPRASESIVFGYFDTTSAHVPLKWVELRQHAPRSRHTRIETGVDNGLFYNFYLEPGSYALSAFGGNTDAGMFQFNVPRQYKATRFEVPRPGIHYLGSFRYVAAEEFGGTPGAYAIIRAEKPTERELLERLLRIVRGTVLESRLRGRLEELR